MANEQPYRWNTSEAAAAFDQAAEAIHPFYLRVQDEVLSRLPLSASAAFLVVDLGGGSGRLVERLLERFTNGRAVVVDQSEPFLALAERRLKRFGNRAMLVQERLQSNWSAVLPAKPQAIVSMSAIHHLDLVEKRALYRRCHEVLSDGGVFINADECRPPDDAEYLAQLQWWGELMQTAQQRGQVPVSFQPVLEGWYDRNIRRFHQIKNSGDDCRETIAAQIADLRDAGFVEADVPWTEKLWAVSLAQKGGRLQV